MVLSERHDSESWIALRNHVDERQEVPGGVWRVLSANSPTGCSAKSACHGSRLRARRGGPFAATRAYADTRVLTTRLAVFQISYLHGLNECVPLTLVKG